LRELWPVAKTAGRRERRMASGTIKRLMSVIVKRAKGGKQSDWWNAKAKNEMRNFLGQPAFYKGRHGRSLTQGTQD